MRTGTFYGLVGVGGALIVANVVVHSCTAPVQPVPGELEAARAAINAMRAAQDPAEHFDLADALVPTRELHAGGPPKDGIPALTDPARVPVNAIDGDRDGTRVIVVALPEEAVAYPFDILNYHEIVNDTVAGVPIAVVSCPLCDSASVVERRLANGVELEFGVSGLLHQSNVVLYDRGTDGLWSQIRMQAISGPHAGTELAHLPVVVTSLGAFRAAHPNGEVLGRETGHDRPYDVHPYAEYFADPTMTFRGFRTPDERLAQRALGLGIAAGATRIFAPATWLAGGERIVETPLGPVRATADAAGVRVLAAPSGARTIQTYWHAWSAAHEATMIAGE